MENELPEEVKDIDTKMNKKNSFIYKLRSI